MTQTTYAKDIRLFGVGENLINRFNKIRTFLRQKYSKIIIRKSLIELPIQILNGIILIAILIFIIKSNLTGKISLGSVVMYMQGTIRAISAMLRMIGGINGIMANNLFLKNLFEFLDLKKRIVDSKHNIILKTPLNEGISFSDVSFRYPNTDRLVLQNLDFSLKPGEVVGLTGSNGSGKSTLIKLLCRLYEPTDGKITIEGTDLHNVDIQNLRTNMSVLFQDYGRFYFTLKENIILSEKGDSEDINRLEMSMRNALVDEIKDRFKYGLDQILGTWFEKGTELSYGEWQKIALARVFYRKAPIVILDEPTSSQDMESERLITDNIIKNRGNNIILIISHRQEILNISDRILVLNNGRIIDEIKPERSNNHEGI